MAYRCVATSVAGFVQQLAVAYVANGYWFDVTGRVRDRVLDGTDPQYFAEQALLLRYPSLEEPPLNRRRCFKRVGPEDEGSDLWNTMNRSRNL